MPQTIDLADNIRVVGEHEPPAALSCAIVVPIFNEEHSIETTIDAIRRVTAEVPDCQVIAVNDGSSDSSGEILDRLEPQYDNLTVVHHLANQGYGAAIKTGMRYADGDLIAITDADGSYPIEDLPKLIRICYERDMVVGSRTGEDVSYSRLRALPKVFLKAWISWIARHKVPDINSGLRVFRKDTAMHYFGIYPNAFSFTITITLAMLTNNHRVHFEPINYARRVGKSKIRPVRDTLRFLALILRTGIYFAPLRIFMPFFLFTFLLLIGSLIHDIFVQNNLTDKTVILLVISLNTAMFGLLADMIDKRSKSWRM